MRSLLELELRPDAERQPHAPVSRLEAVDPVDAFEVRRAEAHVASRTFQSAVTEAIREAQLGAVRIGCERGIGASLLVDAERQPVAEASLLRLPVQHQAQVALLERGAAGAERRRAHAQHRHDAQARRLVRRRDRARQNDRVAGVEERVVLLGARHVDADEPWLARVLHAPGRAFRRDLLRTEAERLARAGDQRIAVAGAEDPALAEDIAVIEGALAMTETRTC